VARLLLLDNDTRILELFALYLGKRGHVVRTASTFRAARVALAAERPELFLSDLELGVESGRVELPRLSEEGLLPPTLVVSGFVDAELQRFFETIPAIVGCLPKPFDLERLDAALADALARAAEIAPTLARATSEGANVSGPPAKTMTASASDEDGWTEVLP
jgi:DNA-binding NtrC family response regulator